MTSVTRKSFCELIGTPETEALALVKSTSNTIGADFVESLSKIIDDEFFFNS